MALPKAIQRLADEAAVIEQNLQGDTATQLQDVQDLQPQPTDVALAPTQVAPAQPPANTEDWQHKYRTLQGLFNQKTADLHAQVKTYESQMANLQKQVTALAAQKEAVPAKKAEADPKDVENFGADMIEMVQRYAEQMFRTVSDQLGSKFAELEGRVTGIEAQVSGVSQRTDTTLEQQFYATIGQLVPDWETINTDPRWLQWLAEVDPVYGAPRQAALDAAHQNMNAPRVAQVFKSFAASHPVRAPESLANQVAPSTAAPSSNYVQPTTKPVYSAKSVEKFYRDVAQGRYAGKEAEAARMEAEIDLAAAEGRIR